MAALPVHQFRGPAGVDLAWREAGDGGRPVVLLHSLFGNGATLAGTPLAQALVAGGYRVILPDLRGHGDGERPHDPARYPPDVAADDLLALIAHLRLDDYDLAGYSLGGKLVLRLLARGARPAHAVVGAQGLDALDAASSRTDGYRRLLATAASGDAPAPGSPEEAAARWLAQSGADPLAVSHLLGSLVATPPAALSQVTVPVLVIVGDADPRGTPAGELAGLFPDARVVQVPGDHETALAAPGFGAAVLEFLGS
jgi:pimeloyl-ACP methyl ester carboxylesterase